MFHIISQSLVIFFSCWVEIKRHDGNENSLDLMYIIVIFHEHNLCSNSKWKIVPNPFFTKFENVHKFVMSCDLTSFKHMDGKIC
jgi:hypothetical protein